MNETTEFEGGTPCSKAMVDRWLCEVEPPGPCEVDMILEIDKLIDSPTLGPPSEVTEATRPMFTLECHAQTTPLACPKSSQRAKESDLQRMKTQVLNKIMYLETEQLANQKAESLFQPEVETHTQNLQGEFDVEVEKHKDNPRLYALLQKYREVFGPLPPPSEACPLVQMDLQLKEEWLGKPLRQKCWPMPKADMDELEMQAEELVRAGLAEAYPPGNTHKCAHPPFWSIRKIPPQGGW